MADSLRDRVEVAARSYASACANHEHDKQKPGGSRDSRHRQWDRLAVLFSEIDEVERDHEVILGALRSLVAALDACGPGIEAAFMSQHVHGGRYDGPTYTVELELAAAIVGSPDA